MFEGLSVLNVAIVVVAVAAVVWPASRICRRTGHSPWLGLVAMLPGVNFLLLWFIAFASWPAVDPRRAT